jgi:hypothetical protein
MRIISFTVLVIFVAGASIGAAQMYDQNYNGPVNAYGQPSYSAAPQNPTGQPQQAPSGLIPSAGNALQRAGGYLWSFMPAPMRGEPPANTVPAGQGQANIIFVPGNQ